MNSPRTIEEVMQDMNAWAMAKGIALGKNPWSIRQQLFRGWNMPLTVTEIYDPGHGTWPVFASVTTK